MYQSLRTQPKNGARGCLYFLFVNYRKSFGSIGNALSPLLLLLAPCCLCANRAAEWIPKRTTLEPLTTEIVCYLYLHSYFIHSTIWTTVCYNNWLICCHVKNASRRIQKHWILYLLGVFKQTFNTHIDFHRCFPSSSAAKHRPVMAERRRRRSGPGRGCEILLFLLQWFLRKLARSLSRFVCLWIRCEAVWGARLESVSQHASLKVRLAV